MLILMFKDSKAQFNIQINVMNINFVNLFKKKILSRSQKWGKAMTAGTKIF